MRHWDTRPASQLDDVPAVSEHHLCTQRRALCTQSPPTIRSVPMYLIREIMYCKPGKVRPMVDKFVAMSKLGENSGMRGMRVMTDFSAERYWTVVAEMQVADLASFEKMMSAPAGSSDDMKKMEEIMKDYHDLVDHGKREIYKIEG
jgi:hypothetical protein